jgi:hypothetical protein
MVNIALSVELRSLSTEDEESSSWTEDTVNDGDEVGGARVDDDGTSIK